MALRSGSWLKAAAVCLAMAVVPLLAWLAIPRPHPQPPLAAPRRPLPAPATPAPTAQTPDEGARIVFGTISGPDGAALSDVEIRVDGIDGLRARSSADGSYRLRAVPLDDLELLVSAKGHLEQRVSLGEGEVGARQQLDVTLDLAPDVEGVVLNPKGEPAARANVVCSDRKDNALVAVTTRDGHFELPPRAAGCQAVASLLGFGDSSPTQLTAGAKNQLQLNVGASISGTVFDGQGLPLHAYSIAIESFRAADGESRLDRTGGRQQVADPSGDFTLSGLLPGRYVLAVNAPGLPPAHSDDIEVGNGEAVRGVRIKVEKGGSLSGIISDAQSGTPIAGARVSMDISSMAGGRARTRSDESGNYQLDGLPTAPFSLRVSADGYGSRILSNLSTTSGRMEQRDVTLEKLADGERRRTVYSGVGIQLGMSPNGVVVGRVFNGSPAEEAGLKTGDVVMLIDGTDATSLTVGQAVETIRGPEGSRVALTVMRDGQRQSMVVTRTSVKR